MLNMRIVISHVEIAMLQLNSQMGRRWGMYTKDKKPMRAKETVKTVLSYPIANGIPERNISPRICERYGVRCSYSEEDGTTITALYFPSTKRGKVIGFKKKDLTLDKGDKYHFTTVGTVSPSNEFFGQSVCNTSGAKVFIAEGELDVLACCQALVDNLPPKYKDLSPTAIGLTNGTSHITENFESNEGWLSGFKDHVLALDMDKATQSEGEKGIIKGQDAVAMVAGLNPNIKHALLTEHDPSDMLMADKSEELYWCLLGAKTYEPAGFLTVDDVFEEAIKMPEWGRPWPWPSLTKATYGRREGEGYYIGAGVKIGKSEWVNQLTQHIIVEENLPVALFKLEEKPAMTVRRVAGKIKHKQFHIPDGDFTQEELIEGVNSLKGKIHMFDSYGATRWDKLKIAIRQAVILYGCKDIFIDPITRLTAGMSPSETETELRKFSDEISKMAKDLGFTYYCFCHLRAPQTGQPHERGGRVQSNQFRGSRAMMESTYYMLGIQRNKDPELSEEERNTSKFVLLEDRAFGNAVEFDVYYNPETGDYLEPDAVKEF